MKKLNKKETKILFGGAVTNGSVFYIKGYRNVCDHSCPKGNRRQHDVSGRTVYHICLNAP